MDITKMIQEMQAKREADKVRFETLDDDLCMICGACGADKRSLFIGCGYDVSEVIPEAIDLTLCDDIYKNRGWYLLLCKACRGEMLAGLRAVFDARRALRSSRIRMDHDGNVDTDYDVNRNIPVRINGAIKMMNKDEFTAWRRGTGNL